MTRGRDQRGAALIMVLGFLLAMTMFVTLFHSAITRVSDDSMRADRQLAVGAIAEAGADYAVAKLRQDREFTGESGFRLGDGTFTVGVARDGSDPNRFTIHVNAALLDGGHVRAKTVRRAEVVFDSGGGVRSFFITEDARE